MDDGVLEAARAVRPFLVELVGRASSQVDGELATLLGAAASGENVETELRAVLEAHEGTTVFLERVLDDAPLFRPPRNSVARGDYQGLAGGWTPILADKFHCPRGDYVWYRPDLGVAVPDCPTHRCTLVLV